jgi:hypothetical protein
VRAGQAEVTARTIRGTLGIRTRGDSGPRAPQGWGESVTPGSRRICRGSRVALRVRERSPAGGRPKSGREFVGGLLGAEPRIVVRCSPEVPDHLTHAIPVRGDRLQGGAQRRDGEHAPLHERGDALDAGHPVGQGVAHLAVDAPEFGGPAVQFPDLRQQLGVGHPEVGQPGVCPPASERTFLIHVRAVVERMARHVHLRPEQSDAWGLITRRGQRGRG